VLPGTSAAAPRPESYHGDTTDKPWAVAFVWGDPPRPVVERVICSGVLVHARYVLTAQHCVRGDGHRVEVGTKAVIGRARLTSSAGEVLRVDKVFRMPGFEIDGHVIRSDLALIRLNRSSTRTPLPLATSGVSSEWGAGIDARAYGYGKRSTDDTDRSERLRTVKLRINTLTPDGARRGEGLTATWTGFQLCSGDSGGPFVKKTSRGERLIAITSDVSAGSSYQCDGRVGNNFIRVGNRGSVSNSPGYYWVTRCITDNRTCNTYPS
jgi:secreted trypsin-like serine protease